MPKRIQAVVIAALLVAAPGWAQEEPATQPPEEIVERILELHGQIEQLLAALAPEARDELRRRLARLEGAEPGQPLPAVPAPDQIVEAPPPERAPTPAAPAASPTAEADPGAMEAPESAPVTAVAAATHPPPASEIPKLIRRRSRRAECNTLRPLDENGDGKISSADRYWRYLYLWTDKNSDSQVQEREVESAYDRRVREIAASLETFIRTKGGLGEIRIEDRVVLDLKGDGFSERARGDDGVLVVDATALRRGDGPRLLGPGGETLDGFQPFRSGLRLEASGNVLELSCP